MIKNEINSGILNNPFHEERHKIYKIKIVGCY